MSKRILPALPSITAASADAAGISPEMLAKWNPLLAATAAEGETDNVIQILEPIGAGFFSEGFTPRRMAAALRAIGPRDVIVHINSPGGRIDDGTTIYNMLRQHDGEVTVKILGMAASIASIIAMAGDRIEIAKAGFVFVHNGETVAVGNKHVMDEAKAALLEFDATMRDVYADRTGLAARDIEKLLDGKNNGGTLMSSATALEKGFADDLLPGDAVTKKTDKTARADIAAVRRLEALATSSDQASRSEVAALLKTIKAGLRDAAGSTGLRDAADDVLRDADVTTVFNRMDAVSSCISKP